MALRPTGYLQVFVVVITTILFKHDFLFIAALNVVVVVQTRTGDILAFAEGRLDSSADCSPKRIVMKRWLKHFCEV